MTDTDSLFEQLLGTWVSKNEYSRLRFCRDMSWHEATYAYSADRRRGTRSILHGHFSFDGSTLVLTATYASFIRWTPQGGVKVKRVVSHLATTTNLVNHINHKMLVLGGYLQGHDEELAKVGEVTTYLKTKRVLKAFEGGKA